MGSFFFAIHTCVKFSPHSGTTAAVGSSERDEVEGSEKKKQERENVRERKGREKRGGGGQKVTVGEGRESEKTDHGVKKIYNKEKKKRRCREPFHPLSDVLGNGP